MEVMPASSRGPRMTGADAMLLGAPHVVSDGIADGQRIALSSDEDVGLTLGMTGRLPAILSA
jgi:hypothetical protein